MWDNEDHEEEKDMLQKQQVEELKKRRSELAIAVHFYYVALKEIIEDCNRECVREEPIKALLKSYDSDGKILQKVEELIISLEITENELYYNYTVSMNKSAEVACLLMEYATNLIWLVASTEVIRDELQTQFLDFQDFIRSLFIKGKPVLN